MTLQLSALARNNRLDSFETTVGVSPLLRIYSGAPPANAAAAATGTLLVEATLPSDWLAAASGGTKSKSGTWEDVSANNTGVAGHFRIYESTGTTCHLQGTVTATAGGGDMTVDNTSINAGQDVTVTSFVLSDGNA